MSLFMCKLEQFDLLNLKDWGFLGYAAIFTNTNAQFFLVLSLGLLSLFFLHYNYNCFWFFSSFKPLRHARHSGVTLAYVVHLLSVAFFGMLSHKYNLGFDVALVQQSKMVVEAAVETANLTAPLAPLATAANLTAPLAPLATAANLTAPLVPLATAVKVGFLKTVGFSYKLTQPIPLPFIMGDGTVEGAMKVIANHTFYLCFWDLDLPGRVALARTLSATGDYGRLFLYASPLHNGFHISVKLLQVLSSPHNAAEQARATAIAHAYGLDHPINCYQWLIMRVPPL